MKGAILIGQVLMIAVVVVGVSLLSIPAAWIVAGVLGFAALEAAAARMDERRKT